uniref:Putative group xii secretory phospholipase a2 n=1 Tax=Lutzomyia longipalpis TaxID=7200 RepID=A0A7G3AJ70_LUTLO
MESVFGDVFRNIGPIAQKFKNVQELFDATVEEDCIFNCPGVFRMRITYWKVAIYCITFLAYAYSGYGWNIISNLRDSLLAMESVFGDVFRNIGPIAQKFKNVQELFDATVEEDCIFNCPGPGGESPKQNWYYTPEPNGCGSMGLTVDKQFLPAAEMEKCCNAHDICYGTCNTDKELCDAEFKKCLYHQCEQNRNFNELQLRGCKATAKLLFTGTLALGCPAFLAAQEKSCYCSGTKRRKTRKDGGEL